MEGGWGVEREKVFSTLKYWDASFNLKYKTKKCKVYVACILKVHTMSLEV